MDFGIKIGTPEKQRGACVVVGIFESRKLTDSAKILDKITQGYIKKILSLGDRFNGHRSSVRIVEERFNSDGGFGDSVQANCCAGWPDNRD